MQASVGLSMPSLEALDLEHFKPNLGNRFHDHHPIWSPIIAWLLKWLVDICSDVNAVLDVIW